MKRRNFLKSASPFFLTPIASAFPGIELFAHPIEYRNLNQLLAELVLENDRLVSSQLNKQVHAPGERTDGGIYDRYGIPTAGGAAMFIQRLASAFVAVKSIYHQDENLLKAMENAAAFLLRMQHPDGTIDLHTTNFHSTPDTGFVAEPLCLAYGILQKFAPEKSENLRSSLKTFLQQAAKAFRVGGIHTPNHRWVVCMALARIQHLFPHPDNIRRVNEWLNEQIDIDPDGQYTEKSSLVYTPLTNRCLITIARLLNKPELFEPVRRNLNMTLYYIHPNGEVVSEASGRQDQYRAGTMENYFYPYHYMAIRDQQPVFAHLSYSIPQQLGSAKLTRYLAYFQEDDFLMKALPEAAPPPTDYVRAFPHSHLLRIRRGAYDATILARNNTFFTFQHGEAVLQGIRLNASFFGSKGQFVPDEVEMEGQTIRLRDSATGPYYQPLPTDLLPGDGNWHNMPREQRPQSEVQQLDYEVDISEKEGGFVLEFTLSGTDHVPMAIELGFRKGGRLSGVSTVEGIEDAYLLEGTQGVYHYGNDSIHFGPGSGAHRWTQLRGAPPKMDAMSVYICGVTPFQFTLEVYAGA